MITTCKFFNQRGGCRNGYQCAYSHVSKRVKVQQMCPIFRNGERCVNFKTCKFRHYALKRERFDTKFVRFLSAQKYWKQKAIESEKMKFSIACGYNKHWANDLFVIRQIIGDRFPDPLLNLIGEYHTSDMPSVNWSPLFYLGDYHRPDYQYDNKDDLQKCSRCTKKCNDVWVIIYPRVVFDRDLQHFNYQKCCGRCLRFDLEHDADSKVESQTILVSEEWRPIVNWEKPIDVKWSGHKLILNNTHTRLRMFEISSYCWVVPSFMFVRTLSEFSTKTLRELLEFEPVDGESLLHRP